MKNKIDSLDSVLKRDADVVFGVSLTDDGLRIHTDSRYDSPVDLSVRLTDAEKRLMEEAL